MSKNKSELVKQIEAYGLKGKLAALARKEESKRPFHHLPKQFSKGILIGNVAIVPKKSTGTRYVYVIADMLEAKLLHEDINLKQTAILVAHHLADEKSLPTNVLELDTKFASQLFNITSSNRCKYISSLLSSCSFCAILPIRLALVILNSCEAKCVSYSIT